MTGPTRQPYLPVITITKNDATTYVFNHFTSSYDFRVGSWRCTPSFDNTGGTFKLKIMRDSNADMNTFLSNVSAGNEILFEAGKTDAGKVKIFRGMIESIEIEEPNKNYMEVTLDGPDWGTDLLKGRVVNGFREQKKAANGTDLDGSDNNVLVEKIAQDMLTQTEWYKTTDVTAQQQGITVDASNFKVTGLRLVNFEANMEKLSDKLTELADMAGCVWWVDADKVFHFADPLITESGILLTDDPEDSLLTSATPWTAAKVGYIFPGTKTKRTLESHRRRIFGVGGDNTNLLDQKQEGVTSNQAIDTSYYAIKFRPTKADCPKIAVYVGKTGTSQGSDFFIELREDNSNTPNGSVVRSWNKEKAKLNTTAQITSDPNLGWHYFPVNEKLNIAIDYWIVIRPPNVSSSPSNVWNWYKDATATSFTTASSTNGVSWVTGNGGYSFRQYYTERTLVIYPHTQFTGSTKHLWEEVIRKPDITDQQVMNKLVTAEAITLTRRKDMLKASIYAPDTLMQTGNIVRIRKQQSGLLVDIEAVLGEIEYWGEGGDSTATGTFYFDITATTFVNIT